MAEEKVNGKSFLNWLSLEEIDDSLLDVSDDLSGGARHMLKDQRELVLIQMRRKAIISESPIGAIKAILEIPAGEDLDEEIVSLGEISVRILFARAKEHLSVDEVELAGRILKRMYPDGGQGLGDEPWKTMFLENAKKFFPADAEKMVKAVKEAGIDEREYVQVIWERAIDILSDDEMLLKQVKRNDDFVKIVVYVDEYMHNQSSLHEQRLFDIGDILLSQGYIYAACNVYKTIKQQNFFVDDTRKKIIEIGRRYADETNFTNEKAVKQIKKAIAKSGLAIKVE